MTQLEQYRKSQSRKIIFSIVLILVLMGGTNFLYIQESNTVDKGVANYNLTYRYYVENQGAMNLTYLSTRLAIMKTWNPVQTVHNISISKDPNATLVDEYDNQYAFYEYNGFSSGEVLDISFNVNLTVHLLDYSTSDLFTKDYDTRSDDYLLYSAYDPLADPNDLRISQVANRLASESQDLNELVFNTYNFSSTYLNYRLLSSSRGAAFAITNGYGDCDEYQNLFIALSRSNGIPAIGHTAWLADFQEGMVTTDEGAVAHAYPMIYTPSFGLLPIDPTRGKDQLFDNWLKTDHKRITMTRGPNHPYRLLNYRWIPQDGVPDPLLQSNYTITINRLNIEFTSIIRQIVIYTLIGIPVIFTIYSALKFRESRKLQEEKLEKLLEPTRREAEIDSMDNLR